MGFIGACGLKASGVGFRIPGLGSRAQGYVAASWQSAKIRCGICLTMKPCRWLSIGFVS